MKIAAALSLAYSATNLQIASGFVIPNRSSPTKNTFVSAESEASAASGTSSGVEKWMNEAFDSVVATFSGGPALGDKFPNLVGMTQDTDEFDLYEYLGDDSWGVVFMHPGDFTPVCTTELGAAALREAEFSKRNTKLCGFSCNDQSSHQSWLNDIAALTEDGTTVTFPLFCDPERNWATKLGVLDLSNKDSKGLPLTVRSVYILKPDKTVALMITYPASTGRNFDEIIRVLDSVQLTASNSVATPVDWKKGDDVIVNFPLSNADADKKFGPDGYRVVEVPSEAGKTDLVKNYLRYTKDPSRPSDEEETSEKVGIFGRIRRRLHL